MHVNVNDANGNTAVTDIVNTPTFFTQRTVTFTPGTGQNPNFVDPNPNDTHGVSAIAYNAGDPKLTPFIGTGTITLPVFATATSSYTNSTGNGAGARSRRPRPRCRFTTFMPWSPNRRASF